MTMRITKTSGKIFKLLLRNFSADFNINQIAKNISMSVGGVFKDLKQLEKNRLVVRGEFGNSVCYKLNLDDLKCQKLCELILMEERDLDKPFVSVISKDIERYLDRISRITILFGSAVRKSEPRDIDVLIVTERRFVREVEKLCRNLSEIHDKKFSPLIMTYPDMISNLERRDEVLLDIIKTGIVLKGYDFFVKGIAEAMK